MKKLVYILLSAICSYNAFADSAESTPLNTQKESAPIVVAAHQPIQMLVQLDVTTMPKTHMVG